MTLPLAMFGVAMLFFVLAGLKRERAIALAPTNDERSLQSKDMKLFRIYLYTGWMFFIIGNVFSIAL